MKERRIRPDSMMKYLLRSNTKLLLSGVLLFQVTAMALLTLKTAPLDGQALALAVAMPLVTWRSVALFSRRWHVDRALMILALMLASVGLVTLKGIARSRVTPRHQALFILGGLAAMAAGVALMRGLRRHERLRLPAGLIALGALALPLAVGSWKYGAKNWISLGSVSIQPSEFVKPVLVLILASALSNRPRFVRCLPALALSAALCGLLLAERDLGALLIYFLVTCAMFFAASGNLPATLAGLGMGAGGAVIAYRLFPYVQKRVEMWRNPWSDPLDRGHQLVQALIAIASGGLFGMGLGQGYPRNIPLYHSDFIFAAICEEFGLVFAAGVILLYALIVLRGVGVAMNARTSFHALVALGVTALIGVQTFIIIGGNIQLIPLTGVTLPFVSAGGSSMVGMMGAFGLLLGVSSINACDEADDYERLRAREEGA